MNTLKKFTYATLISLLLAGCATSNSLNPPTGNAAGAVAGGVVGASAAALLTAPKPVIALAGIGGAGLGYYLTTLRFTSRGIIAAGGQVYTLGDYVIINVPTDNLFDPNTADFLPNTKPILQSIYNVLHRYPNHSIIISGNTSGSWTSRFEQAMSLCRAEQVASYLWSEGIGTAVGTPGYNQEPSRTFVGYGDKFPIANRIHMKGIRQNSRIQIIAYRNHEATNWGQCRNHFKEFDGNVENLQAVARAMEADHYNYAFSDDAIPTTHTADDDIKYDGRVDSVIPETESNAVG